MSSVYLGSIQLVAFNFAPKGFALCNGQLLPINQNQALFSLLGTTYGGNGTTTFQLPNLQSRVAIHSGTGYTLGQTGGVETVALTLAQMPAHTHTLTVSNSAAPLLNAPGGNTTGSPGQFIYNSTMSAVMDPSSLSMTGTALGHENRPPLLTLNYVIALQGIFPSRN